MEIGFMAGNVPVQRMRLIDLKDGVELWHEQAVEADRKWLARSSNNQKVFEIVPFSCQDIEEAQLWQRKLAKRVMDQGRAEIGQK